MRSSPNVHSFLNTDNNNEFIGYCLEADFTAEHEWGINDIYESFGVEIKDKSKLSVNRRKAIHIPNNKLFYLSNRNEAYLFFSDWFYETLTIDLFKTEYKSELYFKDNGLAGAWSGQDFVIGGKGKENKNNLKTLYEYILDKDVLFYIGGSNNPFDRGGLVIAIASRFPKDLSEEMYNLDVSQDRLEEFVLETGIKEKLKKAGKTYYALSPKWWNGSNSEVRFWLNPMEQNKNNACWCTLEDLENWINGIGKIPKTST